MIYGTATLTPELKAFADECLKKKVAGKYQHGCDVVTIADDGTASVRLYAAGVTLVYPETEAVESNE